MNNDYKLPNKQPKLQTSRETFPKPAPKQPKPMPSPRFRKTRKGVANG